jgi:hypothetical protein
MAKTVTYKLQCACTACRKIRMVTLPEGQEPKEMCSGRRMEILMAFPPTDTADGDKTEESEAF